MQHRSGGVDRGARRRGKRVFGLGAWGSWTRMQVERGRGGTAGHGFK